uniref:Uncharacterized protein n=1 Tax=viral metagenome TaxID=1070528 RepID=A0A6M3L081_9ZZZZ
MAEEKGCDFCPGRFLRYTVKLDFQLPTKYCSKCGKQLVIQKQPNVTQYNTETGKPYRVEATLICPDWRPPKRDWIHPKTKVKSEHDSRDFRGVYEGDEMKWVS